MANQVYSGNSELDQKINEWLNWDQVIFHSLNFLNLI